jgi:ketosteroid isomerase-like protein
MRRSFQVSNLQKINAFFSAYANKDVSAVGDVMAEDIVWRIPGHHSLAGEDRRAGGTMSWIIIAAGALRVAGWI